MVLGSDVAGTVVKGGPNVVRIKVDDRVAGSAAHSTRLDGFQALRPLAAAILNLQVRSQLFAFCLILYNDAKVLYISESSLYKTNILNASTHEHFSLLVVCCFRSFAKGNRYASNMSYDLNQ